MAAEQTPRVNATFLGKFVGKTVRITGKVTDLRGKTATIDAHGLVTINLTTDSHFVMDHVVEVIGKATSDGSVMAFIETDFGLNCDLSAIEAVVQATHAYPAIFYDN